MKKSRLIPYGLGKCLIEIQKYELPTDILEALTERYKNGEHGIKENTNRILLIIEHVIGKE